MAFDGNGNYSAPASSFNPAVSATDIDPTDWNALLADLTTALSTVICKDGQTTTTASVPFAQGLSCASTLSMTGTAANISLGSNYLSGDGADEGLLITSAGVVSFNPTGTRYGAVFNPKSGDGGTGYVFVDNSGAGFTNANPFQEMFYCDRTGTQAVIYVGGTQRVSVASGGSVTFNAYGAGTLVTGSSGVITASSDERLKRDIRPFERGLDAIEGITPILHGWKSETGMDQSRTNYAGFSAQDVQKVIPEAVDGEDVLTFSDRPVIAALVNAVKELSLRVKALEAD
jgi:hypothetical protein